MTRWIEYQDGSGEAQRVELAVATAGEDSTALSVGRDAACDVVLQDVSVADRHCSIIIEDQLVFIADSGTAVGVRVNDSDVATERQRLHPGDRIEVGRIELRYFEGEGDAAPAPATGVTPAKVPSLSVGGERELKAVEGQVIGAIHAAEVLRIPSLVPGLSDSDELARVPGLGGSQEQTEALARSLLVIYHLAHKLNQAHSLKELLESAVDVAVEITGASRGYLGLLDDDVPPGADPADYLVPVVERDPTAALYDGNFKVSHTITNKVVREGIAVISRDAGADPALQTSESIALLDIRSALAVPLWAANRSLGVLYVDSVHEADKFGPAHLEILTAVGHEAAKAILRLRSMEELHESQEMRHNLLRFLTPEVVDRILEDRLAAGRDPLSPGETVATVLVADLAGFDAFAEEVAPAVLSEILEAFYSATTHVIFKHQGALDKYNGGKAIGFFGPPYPQGDDAIRAVRAAIDLRVEVARLSGSRPGWPQLQLRVGINSGVVVAGELGSGVRRDYTVLGDAVNVAELLAEAAHPGELLVGGSAARRLEDSVPMKLAFNQALGQRPGEVEGFLIEEGAQVSDEMAGPPVPDAPDATDD